MPADDSGYRLKPADLQFLDISEDAAEHCANRIVPLGMTESDYELFVLELVEALWREQFTDADVRLQGSSAKMFSGPHKEMPYSLDDINETYMREWKKLPTPYQISSVNSKIINVWPVDSDRPKRRPFDALFKVGLSPDKSDYDVQISTDIAFDIIAKMAQVRSLNPDALMMENPDYQFMRKEIADSSFLYLQTWAANWWNILGRPVNIAIFVRSGPRNNAEKGEDLSSHFKETDWIIPISAGAEAQSLQGSGVVGG